MLSLVILMSFSNVSRTGITRSDLAVAFDDVVDFVYREEWLFFCIEYVSLIGTRVPIFLFQRSSILEEFM